MAIDDANKPWYRASAENIFGIDARSLAAFRWTIAVLLLVDLYVRFPTLVDFQTDQGVWTRQLDRDFVHQHFGEMANSPLPEQPLPYWSIHLANGDLWFQHVMFGIQAVAAVLLGIGYRTRLMTFVSWLLLISMHVRNPTILNSGDTLLRMALFWSLFLPLGARWSVDRAFRPSGKPYPPIILSLASAAILLQLCLMYWFTGISKWNPIWFEGQAIHNVINWDLLARPSSKFLLAYPELLKILSWATLWGELVLPCLLFIPFKTSWFRGLNIVAYFAFHIGIVFTVSVGLFSAISMAVWLLFIPRGFWNSGIVRSIAGGIFGSSNLLDEEGELRPESDGPSKLGRMVYVTAQAFVAVMFVYVVAWNVSRIRPGDPNYERFMPMAIRPVGVSLMVAQEFKMFDTPPANNFWFIYHARLKNGDEIDLFSGKPIEGMVKPTDIFERNRDHRWRRMHANLVHPEYKLLHKPLLEYMIAQWDTAHDEPYQVVSARLELFMHDTSKPVEEENITVQILESIETEDAMGQTLDALIRSGNIVP